MALFQWFDLLMYGGLGLAMLGWVMVKRSPKLSYLLNALGGGLVIFFGMAISSTSIIVCNVIWTSISLYHLVGGKE